MTVALGVCLNLIGHDKRRARIGVWEGRDEPIAHVTRLHAKKAPFARVRVRQLLQAAEETHVRGQLVVDGTDCQRAGDEAEGFANGTVAAHANVDRVEGGVDDIDLALVYLGRLAQEVFHIAFVPKRDQLEDQARSTLRVRKKTNQATLMYVTAASGWKVARHRFHWAVSR